MQPNLVQVDAQNIAQKIDAIQNDEANIVKLNEFRDYLSTFWVPLAPVMSVFQQRTRTNNICENFHMRAFQRFGNRQQYHLPDPNLRNDI